MTATANMTHFEKHLQMEERRILAQTRCKVCQKLIGERPHVLFEERYFHLQCLRRKPH